MAKQNPGTQSRGATNRTTGPTTKGSGPTAQSGAQSGARQGTQSQAQRPTDQRSDREQALNVSREKSNPSSTDNTSSSSGASVRATGGSPNTATNQTQPARADGTTVDDRNAESSILPALMSNPWLMTNAFLANPFGFTRAMNQEMDRLFSGSSADVSAYSGRPTAGSRASRSLDVSRPQRGMTEWSPQVEVRQNGNQITVCADLPGLAAKDIDIQVDDGVLTISGERQQSTEDNREGYYRSERSYGAFSRSIPLPDGVNEDQIRAKFENGVLEVTVPVPEQRQRGRRVEIQSGG